MGSSAVRRSSPGRFVDAREGGRFVVGLKAGQLRSARPFGPARHAALIGGRGRDRRNVAGERERALLLAARPATAPAGAKAIATGGPVDGRLLEGETLRLVLERRAADQLNRDDLPGGIVFSLVNSSATSLWPFSILAGLAVTPSGKPAAVTDTASSKPLERATDTFNVAAVPGLQQ